MLESSTAVYPGGGGSSGPASTREPATPAADAEEGTRVRLSPAGQAAASGEAQAANKGSADETPPAVKTPGALTPDQLRQVEQLKARDRTVRAHEQAHQAAAGGLATGGANYTYQRGPDGVDYAIGGEVKISLREGRTPEETIVNAQTIRAAALAPADPSAQDRAVATAATQMEARAQSEAAVQASEGKRDPGEAKTPTTADGAPATPEREAAAVERTRAGLADLYGLIGNSSSGFSAVA